MAVQDFVLSRVLYEMRDCVFRLNDVKELKSSFILIFFNQKHEEMLHLCYVYVLFCITNGTIMLMVLLYYRQWEFMVTMF